MFVDKCNNRMLELDCWKQLVRNLVEPIAGCDDGMNSFRDEAKSVTAQSKGPCLELSLMLVIEFVEIIFEEHVHNQ